MHSRCNNWTTDRNGRTIECRIVDQGRIRDFFGFNRAKHAVVEAAILATRVQWLPPEQLLNQLHELASWVEKTGGDQERHAFAYLQDYVRQNLNHGLSRRAQRE